MKLNFKNIGEALMEGHMSKNIRTEQICLWGKVIQNGWIEKGE